MVATGVTVVDETVSSAAAIGIAGTEVVDVVAGTEVVDVVAGTEVVNVVAGTEVVDVVAGTEVNGVVSAITTVVPRTSEVPGSAEDELSPQPAATITASRHVATRRFTV
jgi:hypothetical protein